MTDMWISTGNHVVVNVAYFGIFNRRVILSDIKQIQNGPLITNAISVTVRDRAKLTKIWDDIQIFIRASFVFFFTIAKTFHDSS